MEKYIAPSIEVVKLETNDVMFLSAEGPLKFDKLDDVDEGDDKSAIFDAVYWTTLTGND